MATRTVRTGLLAVTLTPANNEFLEYRLKIQGSRANFAWADDQENTVLTHLDFGLANELVWRLQTAVVGGQVNVTVPQKAGYQRVEASGTQTAYELSLAFITAVGYTLTVTRCDGTGPLQTVTDIDYKMQQPNDEADEGLSVQLGN